MERYKYIPALLASKDTVNGGYILHFLAPSQDLDEDYLRCSKVDERIGRVYSECFDEEFIPKYYNWFGAHFPLLHCAQPQGSDNYDNLSADIHSLVAIAEKHAIADMLFEQYVYREKGLFKDEMATLNSQELFELITQYRLLSATAGI